MASYQQSDNGDGPIDLTKKATHFFKIIMPGTLDFFVSKNHMVTLTVVHFIFCIYDS